MTLWQRASPSVHSERQVIVRVKCDVRKSSDVKTTSMWCRLTYDGWPSLLTILLQHWTALLRVLCSCYYCYCLGIVCSRNILPLLPILLFPLHAVYQIWVSLHLYQRFPNNFDRPPICLRKITTDPHILAHINMQCPDDRHPNLKTMSQNWF